MKKVILLLLLATGCSPHNHKAQDAISAYMRKTLDVPGDYIPISFGEPHARTPHADTVLINHVYQQRNKSDSLVIDSNVFKVDSLSGYVQLVTAPSAAK